MTMAVALHVGHRRCRYMRANGSLRHTTRCSEPRWIRATGLNHWKLRTTRALPGGTYTAHVRAIDRTGNVELFTRLRGKNRNFLKFRVR